ncbi:MAG: DUF4340 domain-containing protein [Isosphaeraceae bacterium]|nr:DUF4340 domain-containing protein [Isosphaeraceae bacterium]
MKELTKTLIFVGVALVLTGAAMLRIPDRAKDVAFNDQGQPFFPEFKDPFACTDLEVIDYEPSTATASRFEVKWKDGKWVIPSHSDYPADAKDRLAKTAAGVMDLTKDTVRSDRAEDQEEFGVIDPLDAKATSLKGRGKRVTLRDKTEKVLADFIIGKEVKDRSGQRYVRVPGHKQIYGVNVKADLSTKFSDWIETNLLKVDSGRIRRVKFDNHKVDPEQGQLIKGDVVTIERKDSSGPWTIQGQTIPAEQEINTDKLSTMTSALADLKIVGVRPKPEALKKDLKVESGDRLKLSSEQAFRSLFSKGFYLTRDGLYSNQGDVVVSTDEGVVYTLRFGEVVVATGLELTAGGDESASKEKDPSKSKDAAKKSDGASENRYVMVTVAFDPSLLPAEHPPEPEGPLTIPDDPFQKKPDDPKRVAEEKAEKEKRDRETADHKKRVEDGQKRVAELTDRFAGWYYVTPGDSFHSIALTRADLTRKKDEKKPAGSPGGMPDFPGLPPSFKPPGHP